MERLRAMIRPRLSLYGISLLRSRSTYLDLFFNRLF
jgi:hypothetical protein